MRLSGSAGRGQRGFVLRVFQAEYDLCSGEYDAGKTHPSGADRNGLKRGGAVQISGDGGVRRFCLSSLEFNEE